jgi:hypothetical protein
MLIVIRDTSKECVMQANGQQVFKGRLLFIWEVQEKEFIASTFKEIGAILSVSKLSFWSFTVSLSWTDLETEWLSFWWRRGENCLSSNIFLCSCLFSSSLYTFPVLFIICTEMSLEWNMRMKSESRCFHGNINTTTTQGETEKMT